MIGEKKISIKIRAVILYEGKLLVVRHPHDTSFAALPGGHLEWGEDIKACLFREIIEELGLEPEIGRLLYINNFAQDDGTQYVEMFSEELNGGDYVETKNLTGSHSHEIAEIVWIKTADDIRVLPVAFGEDFRKGRVISSEVRYIYESKGGQNTSIRIF